MEKLIITLLAVPPVQSGEESMSCINSVCPFFDRKGEFGDFSDLESACAVAEAVQAVNFKKGELLFLQGESSSNLYSLMDGVVKICSHSADGREQIVGISSPGNLLLGLQSINETRYAYTGIAATAVKACRINHRAMLAHVHNRPDMALRLISAMNAQLAHSRALMQVIGHKCAVAKIASFILLMTPRLEQESDGFSMPFTRMEVASMLALSEETVCRVMARMKRSGAINAPRGRVEILDWQQLHSLSEGDSGTHRAAV